MGRWEAAIASIGIKIKLSDLLVQINEINFNVIKEMLNKGFIEDKNDEHNEVYQEILVELHNNNNWIEYNQKFRDKAGRLLVRSLLIPVKEIFKTERYGYERYGFNGCSRPLDFDLTVALDKYQAIENYEIVFILGQNAG